MDKIKQSFQFSLDVKQIITDTIADNDSGEVFFGCLIDEENIIYEAEAFCYGNEESVIAPSEIADRYDAVLHNHPSGILQPSNQDMNYALHLEKQGIGSFITDNDASKITVVVPPILIKKSKALDKNEVIKFFEKDGILSKSKNDYEFRDSQYKMALSITDHLNNNELKLIEAGTGTGKTLAYLVPVFLWLTKNGGRIVISTNTINLQSQLLNKDIPFVKKMLNSDIQVALVKGRRNYLCKLKLESYQSELDFDDDSKKEQIDMILKWALTTENGVIDELDFVPDNRVWQNFASDSDFCTGSHCGHFTQCFLQKVRRLSSDSSLLIVNHHIAFADLQLRSQGKGLDENALLPPFRRIIFDEAHNIENAARNYFSTTFSKSLHFKFMNYYRPKKGSTFITKLSKTLGRTKDPKLNDIKTIIDDELTTGFQALYTESIEAFRIIVDYLQKLILNSSNNIGRTIRMTFRIHYETWTSDNFDKAVLTPLTNIAIEMSRINKAFDKIFDEIDSLSDKIKEKYENDFRLFKAFHLKFSSYRKELSKLIDSDDPKRVVWFEVNGDPEEPHFVLTASPLYVHDFMDSELYSVFDSIAMVSATLTVNNNFEYFKSISGMHITKRKVEAVSFPSPFDYEKQVLFVVPSDIPDPKALHYNEKINDFIDHSIISSSGSAFILFTSYYQLKKSFESVEETLEDNGIVSYYQGELEKGKLLEKFIEDKSSVLFATDSFWEGVDAPGDTLRYVCLTKLPFRMPNEPLEEARVQDMESKGINPFFSYTLPSAVIRFKQGFGRLIRTCNDKGVVALLDIRSINKPYGKVFFQSLPRCSFYSGTSEETYKKIKDFLG